MLEVYIDGASKGGAGPSGAGIYIKGADFQEKHSIFLGNMDNHEAEFAALVEGLKICINKNYKSASFRTDSQAVDHAVQKRFVKHNRYKPHLQQALALMEQMDLFFLKWIPEKQNKIADELAKKAIWNHEKREQTT